MSKQPVLAQGSRDRTSTCPGLKETQAPFTLKQSYTYPCSSLSGSALCLARCYWKQQHFLSLVKISFFFIKQTMKDYKEYEYILAVCRLVEQSQKVSRQLRLRPILLCDYHFGLA